MWQEGLRELFEAEGFRCDALRVQALRVENRARALAMDRRWVQAAFTLCRSPAAPPSTAAPPGEQHGGGVTHVSGRPRSGGAQPIPPPGRVQPGSAPAASACDGRACAPSQPGAAAAATNQRGGDEQNVRANTLTGSDAPPGLALAGPEPRGRTPPEELDGSCQGCGHPDPPATPGRPADGERDGGQRAACSPGACSSHSQASPGCGRGSPPGAAGRRLPWRDMEAQKGAGGSGDRVGSAVLPAEQTCSSPAEWEARAADDRGSANGEDGGDMSLCALFDGGAPEEVEEVVRASICLVSES